MLYHVVSPLVHCRRILPSGRLITHHIIHASVPFLIILSYKGRDVVTTFRALVDAGCNKDKLKEDVRQHLLIDVLHRCHMYPTNLSLFSP